MDVGELSDGEAVDPGRTIDGWPARSTEGLDFLVDAPTGVRRITRSSFGFHEGRPTGYTYRVRARVLKVERAGLGVIREFEHLPSENDQPAGERPQRTLQFFTASTQRDPRTSRTRWGGPPGVSSPTEFDILPPHSSAARNGRSKGLFIHLQSMGGESYERPVIEELRSRGWWVLQSEFPWAQWRGRRVDVTGVDEIEDAGTMLARILDDRLAEWAYGAEAAIEYLGKHHPEIRQKPLVVAGFSAGALGAPTVAARLVERVDAVVLVGGGANLLKLSQMSELTDAGIRLRWRSGPGKAIPPEEALERIYSVYLRESKLDPYNAAPMLRRTPVLQLHAALDSIVPAALGDDLHDRLGPHECWTFPLGHKLLFWRLKEYRRDIADWVESATGTR